MNPSSIQLFDQAANVSQKTAIIATEGTFSYRQLLQAADQTAARLLAGATDLQESRVAFLVSPGFQYVATLWGIWRAGGIAVPLAISHPPPEHQYVIEDSQADIIVAQPELADRLRPIAKSLGRRFMLTSELLAGEPVTLPQLDLDRRALIVYTSGTTGRPKGVVSTHHNIQAQVTSLISAWGWQADDHILLVLPLHHVHGIINVLTCALWAGAICQILPKFNAEQVWDRFVNSDLTLFMAVPTIYHRLIAAWEAAPPAQQKEMSEACARMRLMVSGSAALPVTVLEKWRRISGHTLLERYGMTEIGMALSNPLHGERVPGFVGTPLPGVTVRLVDEQGHVINTEGTMGEIQVKGPNVFKEYWQKPDATAKSFQDGWFRTGDMAMVENGRYRIIGRSSVDIIKTGGYKVSALEIEEVLRTHPDIQECTVVGVANPAWGEEVCALVILKPGHKLSAGALKAWTKQILAPYKIPRQIRMVDELPRNAMGKVVKPEVRKLFS